MRTVRLALLGLAALACSIYPPTYATPLWPTLSPPPLHPFELPGYLPGIVYFGREVDEGTATITSPVTTFGLHQQIFWAFYTSDQFDVQMISLQVGRCVEGSECGNITVVIQQDLEVVSTQRQLYSYLGPDAIGQPGDYVMDFIISDDISDARIIAQGLFTIT